MYERSGVFKIVNLQYYPNWKYEFLCNALFYLIK